MSFFPPVSTPKHPPLFISQELGEQQTVGCFVLGLILDFG